MRYFVVLILKSDDEFSEWQKKTVRNELDDILKINDAEIEEIEFTDTYATLLAVLPLKVSLKKVFRSAIEECNKYGNFLRTNFIITNVRKLDGNEILDFLEKQEKDK